MIGAAKKHTAASMCGSSWSFTKSASVAYKYQMGVIQGIKAIEDYWVLVIGCIRLIRFIMGLPWIRLHQPALEHGSSKSIRVNSGIRAAGLFLGDPVSGYSKFTQ